MAYAEMNSHRSNADDSGDSIFTRMRVLFSRSSRASSVEPEDVHYSVSAPKKVKLSSTRSRNTFVISRPPSVIFLQEGTKPSQTSESTNLAFSMLSVAFFIYAVPTTLEFFAARHFNPWISTILPGDVTGCLWLAAFFKMRRLGLLLYLVLTASESCLYAFDLVAAGSLVWITDLVPAFFVAVMLSRSSRRYS
jgi:hypothetical protein